MEERRQEALKGSISSVARVTPTGAVAAVRRPPLGDSGEPVRAGEVLRPREIVAEKDRSVARPAVVEPMRRGERLARAVNLTIASLVLLLLLPLCVLIAIAIKLTSRGPILYAQTRVGINRRSMGAFAIRERRREDFGGHVFTLYKFRSMRVNAERLSGVVWAQENDPRVTRLGRYLRILRFDEIPQLWNVLRGDMNIVGPRPERPSIVARLREIIPEYQYRHLVKPGITGLAQINQKYDASIEDVRSKVQWDLEYIRRQGLLLDLRIMLKTVPAVLLKHRGW
jgi:lipopolysaccharide/colanic/teichoic acid biosynthesis glycosyltransferase